MAFTEKEKELIDRLQDAVVNYKVDEARKAAQDAVDAGVNAYTMTMEGLAGGMAVVSEKFDSHEYFVPETLLCAKALYAALDILKPRIKVKDGEVKGQVVLGVLQGDVHDLGKHVVATLCRFNNFNVVNLGKDVPVDSDRKSVG